VKMSSATPCIFNSILIFSFAIYIKFRVIHPFSTLRDVKVFYLITCNNIIYMTLI
jgi:hypothetical protein